MIYLNIKKIRQIQEWKKQDFLNQNQKEIDFKENVTNISQVKIEQFLYLAEQTQSEFYQLNKTKRKSLQKIQQSLKRLSKNLQKLTKSFQELYKNKQVRTMDLQNLSPEQMQKVFKLCDIMSLEDVYLAATILETYEWNVQKAVDQIVYSKQQQHMKQQQPLNPNLPLQQQNPYQNNNLQFNDANQEQDPYRFQQSQEPLDYGEYDYFYPESDFEAKKKMFQENYFAEIPLNKSVSECKSLVNSLKRDQILANDYHKHRHSYQTNLLKRSEEFCQRILESYSKDLTQRNLYILNQSKINNNKKFIVYLHKVYGTKINFTFGTFMLNLIRSYLDDKYLLVFILHEDTMKNVQKVVEKILTQPELTKFINKNCISYGMFDNSDDYEIVQKYVALKQLPAFALFKYSKKERKEQYICSYPFLSNQNQNCIQWLAKSFGISLKKKQSPNKTDHEMQTQSRVVYQSISDILREQNLQYEEIQKLYLKKRQKSKFQKENNKLMEQKIIQMRKKFEQMSQPQLVKGKSIQIKFRMPISGQSKLRVFSIEQKIQQMFNYVEAFHQDQFQDTYCQFDLTQTFPPLSLKDKKEKMIKEVFEDSDRENIIVKEQ